MSLSPDQERVAAAISDIVTATDSDGNRKYSKREIRDYLVACVLEFDWPVTPEVEPHMLAVMAEVKLPQDATDEMIVEGIFNYYKENPLNPDLQATINSFAKSEVLDSKGPGDRGDQAEARQAVGGEDKLQAPDFKPKSRRVLKTLKRGIKDD